MFNLYILKNRNNIDDRTLIAENIPLETLEHDYGLTTEEIDHGIEFGVMRDFYYLELTEEFLESINPQAQPFDLWYTGNPGSDNLKGKVVEEISRQLGISHATTKITLRNALAKLKNRGRDRELLGLLVEYYDRLRVLGRG